MSQARVIDRPGPADRADAVPGGIRRWSRRHLLIALAACVLLIFAGFYGDYWWNTGRFLVTTDDAYVQVHSALIAPQVSGYITAVPVDDNQKVHAGQVLARIDPRLYQAALDQARANVAAARASIGTLQQQIAQQNLTVEQDRQQVTADQAALVYSRQNFVRDTTLAHDGWGTVQNAQQATADIQEKAATLQRDATGVAAAKKQIAVYAAQLAQAEATLAQQQAAEKQAALNLGYTTIVAPVDGTIGVRTATVGPYVEAGTQLMAVVPLHDVYITANYKETQLTDVWPGQPVAIEVDTFPGTTVHGTVESLAPASGENFALLPPDNATGNFTKIVQRIPVKIAINKNDPLLGELRPGMSVEPTIDTKPRASSTARPVVGQPAKFTALGALTEWLRGPARPVEQRNLPHVATMIARVS
jgi:membrane fusion protein, multidrug efflux system